MPNNLTVPLKEHLESRLQAIEKSIEVANTAMQNRLTAMNEFREQLKDQAAKFIVRSDVEFMRDQLRAEKGQSVAELRSAIDHISDDIDELKKFQATMEGKASQSQVNIALIVSVIGILMGMAGIITSFLN